MLHSTSVHVGRSSAEHKWTRHVVVAVDLQDTSLRALQWTIREFVRPTKDCVHIVHIDRYQSPQMSIQHAYPGASYTIPDLNPMDVDQHADAVKGVLHARFTSLLEQQGIAHVLHLFTDTDNAPASAVADVLFKVASEVKASLLVVAAHNKAYGWNELLLGSVADYCVQHSTTPLMVVRDYLTAPQGGPTSANGTPTAAAAAAAKPTAVKEQQQQPATPVPSEIVAQQQQQQLARQSSAPTSPSAAVPDAQRPTAAAAAAGVSPAAMARASSLKHPGELATSLSGGAGAMPSTLVIPWTSPATSPVTSPTASTMLRRLGLSGGGNPPPAPPQ